jgi:ABC-type glycerol-3-phosphate transport system substrate-binding protein
MPPLEASHGAAERVFPMSSALWSRRSLLRLVALSTAGLGLAGCGLLPNILPSQPVVIKKPVTLNLYFGPFFVQGGGQSPETKLMAGIIDNYQKAQPNVTVKATEVTFSIFQDFQNLTDPTSPDHIDLLLGQFTGRFGNVDVTGAISPVDSYLKRDKTVTAASFYPAAMHLWWSAGKQLGLPRDIQPTDIIYYNRTLLKNAGMKDPGDGWTTDDFLSFLQQLSKAGQAVPANNPAHWAYVDIDPRTGFDDFIYIFGGRATNYPADPPRAMFDTDQAISGGRFYADLYNRYHYAADALGRSGAYSLGPIPDFLLGHVPLLLAPSNLIPTMQSVQHPLDWDITLEPIKTDVKQSWYGSGLGAFIMKAASDADACWNLLTYLVAGDGIKQRAAVGDVHPAFMKVASSSAYTAGKAPLGKRLFNTVGMSQMIDVDPSTLPPAAGTPVPGSVPNTQAMFQDISYNLDDALSGKTDVAAMLRQATQAGNTPGGR